MRLLIAALAAAVLALPATATAHTIRFEFGVQTGLGADPGRFSKIARQALNSQDGWSLGRRIVFRTTPRDADFRLIVASPAVVEDAAPGCSARWSCRVGDRVYINELRWLEKSPDWPGNLYTYRAYVVNHEVGHWLGLGHLDCPEAGAPAPVMMQQSKGFRPCNPNVWPQAYELRRIAPSRDVDWSPGDPTLYLGGFVGSPRDVRWRNRSGNTAQVDPDNLWPELVEASRAARRAGEARIVSVHGGLLYCVNRWGNFERVA
jgi:hypothetical protein